MEVLDVMLYGFIGGGLFVVALLVVLLVVAKVANWRARVAVARDVDMVRALANALLAPDERNGDGGKND